MPSNILTGIDYYDATFHQDRGAFKGITPFHIYDLSQQTRPATGNKLLACCRRPISPTAGASRHQPQREGSLRSDCARFAFDIARPSRSTAARRNTPASRPRSPLYRSVFGLWPRRARVPHPGRRRAGRLGTGFDRLLQSASRNFKLKTQTSHDVEGGFRIKSGRFQMQSSIYAMDLENEIHFIPALFFNVNLDPTRRYGSETSASLRVSDSVPLRGGAYTRAVFREGRSRATTCRWCRAIRGGAA